MGKQLQISIPQPCHEGWENMTPSEKGRFCDSCQKQVVDFSSMNDRQVAEFFKRPSKGSVCGRFMTGQLDRAIDIPKKRIPWVKYFFQVALPAFLVSIKASAQKTVTDTVISPSIDLQKALLGRIGHIIVAEKNIGTIQGFVISETGEPLPGATIKIKGTTTVTASGADGSFRILPKTAMKKLVLEVSYVGYDLLETTVDNESPASLLLMLKQHETFFEGYVVVTTRPAVKKEIKNVPLMPASGQDVKAAFTVFPNPVSPGAMLSIQSKKLKEGTYTLNLLNQSGETVHEQEIVVTDELKQSRIEFPAIAAGPYFLLLINKKTGKKYSEKIIVQ